MNAQHLTQATVNLFNVLTSIQRHRINIYRVLQSY